MSAPNLASYLLIILALLAAWHYFYEAALLPMLRQNVRFKMFALRDRLRWLKHEQRRSVNDEVFQMTDEALSWLIENPDDVSIYFYMETARREKTDAAFRAEIERRRAVLNSCRLHDFIEIRIATANLFRELFGINCLGWTPYILPIVIASVMWDRVTASAKVWSGLNRAELDSLAHSHRQKTAMTHA